MYLRIKILFLGQNNLSIGIAFIGDFTNYYQIPTKKQFKAFELLLEEGVRLNKLEVDYTIYPRNCFAPSESPGNGVIFEINKWDHYYERNKSDTVCWTKN